MIASHLVREALETMTPAERESMDIARVASIGGQLDAVVFLFVAPAYLEFRLSQPDGVAALIGDFDILGSQVSAGEAFGLIADALRLSADILTRDTTQLATQLRARLPANAYPEIGQLSDNLRAETPDAFMPIRTTLIPAAQAFMTRQVADVALAALACAPDGRLAVALDQGCNLHFVSLAKNRLEVVARINCPEASALDFTPSGRSLVVGASSGQISWFEPESRTKLGTSQIAREILDLHCIDDSRALILHKEGASVIDWAEGDELAIVGAQEGVDFFAECAASPDSNRVYTGAMNGRVDAWRSSDGQFAGRVGWFGKFREGWTSRAEGMVEALMRSRTWSASADGASAIDFDAAVSSLPPEFRAAARRMLREDPHRDAVTAVVPSGDGQMVIAGSMSGALCIWSLSSGEKLAALEGHVRGVTSLALEPGGDRLVSAGEDAVRTWSVSRRAPIGELPARTQTPSSVVCPPGGGVVLGAFDDGTLASWNLDRAQVGLHQEIPDDPLRQLSWPPGSPTVWAVSPAGRIEELSVDKGVAIRSTALPIESIHATRLSDCGRRIAACTDAGMYVFDVASRLPMFFMPFQDPSEGREVVEFAVSNDGERIVFASAKESLGALLAKQGRLVLLKMAARERVVLKSDLGSVGAVLLSGDGGIALVESSARVDTEFSREVLTIQLNDEFRARSDDSKTRARGFAFHPDGQTLYWCDGATVVRQRQGTDDRPETVLRTSHTWRSVSISPNGQFVILLDGARMELWELDSRARLAGFEADRSLVSCCVAPQADTLMLLDEKGGLQLLRLPSRENSPARQPHGASGAASEGDHVSDLIDAAYALERDGHGSEAVARWTMLAESPDRPAVLRLGVARILHEVGRRSAADDLLVHIIAQTEGEEQRMAVGLLLEVGSISSVSELLQGGLRADAWNQEVITLLSKAADHLVARNEKDRLRAIAGSVAPGAGPLIATLALAELDEEAASEALQTMTQCGTMDVGYRVIAWLSLRALIPARRWLERLRQDVSVRGWSFSSRLHLGREVLATLQLGTAMPDDRSNAAREIPPIRPLRKPIEWDQEAIALASRGRHDEAIDLVGRAIRRRPRAARYHHTRAMLRLSIARERRDERVSPGHVDPGRQLFELAVEDLSNAIACDRRHDAAWSQRGYAHLELGRYELALHDITEAISLVATDPRDYQNRAYCLKQLGRHAEAEEDEGHAQRLMQYQRQQQEQDSLPIKLAKARMGDDDISDGEDLAEIAPAARAALVSLGVLDEVRAQLRRSVQDPSTPSWLTPEIVNTLSRLGGGEHMEAITADPATPGTARIAALIASVEAGAGGDAVEALTQIAVDPAGGLEDRGRAGLAVAANGPIEDGVALLRRLTDVNFGEDPPPLGTMLATHLLKELYRRPGGSSLILDLAGDAQVSPSLREMACEMVGTFTDAAKGSDLLRALAAELPEDHAVHSFIENALDAFAQRAKAPAPDVPLDPANQTYRDFCRARSADEIDSLARKHRVLHDPDFVDQVVALMSTLSKEERRLQEEKLKRLRELPPDIETVGFRMFARANSPEAMKVVVGQYPFLTMPEYYPVLVKIIEDSVDENSKPAFERRLAWLRALPADPWQVALQAFSNVGTDEELHAAVKLHPRLATPEFQKLARRVLARERNWPALERRLQKLASMAPSDDTEELLDAAQQAVTNGDAEVALELLERLGDRANGKFGRCLRALALVSSGQEEQAIGLLNELIASDPSVTLYVARGRAFNHLRRFREARMDFSKALELKPNIFESLLGRGLANANLNHPEEAIEDLTRAEALNPRDELIYSLRGAMYSALGRIQDALRDFRLGVERCPQATAPRMALAALLMEIGKEEEGLEVLKEARRHAPPEDLAKIDELVGAGDAPAASKQDVDRAFQALMKCRSPDEVFEAIRREPLLSAAGFIDMLERYVRDASDKNAANHCKERLETLKEIVRNPAQLAFDALMAAGGPDELPSLLVQHPLLRDAGFLDHLSQLADQIESGAARQHLHSCVAFLKSN